MTTATTTKWRIAGEELGHCNCDWGCPCQFDALPTHGRCEAFVGFQIREGQFGSTDMAGVTFAKVFSWPGPVHEGNGTRQMIVDSSLTEDQRSALEAIDSGTVGCPFFEIFAQVCPDRLDTVVAPIEFESNREARRGSIRISDIAETQAHPILNPVTQEEHRVRIDLPDGFEYKLAEIGNTVFARVKKNSGVGIAIDLENTYAQLNEFDWSNS